MFGFLKNYKKELIFMCCGNCIEFEPNDKDVEWGFCPAIYWPYDIMKIKVQSFCRDFRIKLEFQDKYKVDKKSRDSKKCLIYRIEALGIKHRSAIISDSVMLTSTSG